MHYLITGGTGFIGTALIESLLRDGHNVTVLTRQSRQSRGPLSFVSSLDSIAADTRIEAVVNLAGASLAGARWSAAYKREIIASRLATTEALVEFFQRLEQPPAALLSASAIGYYGHHGDEPLTEEGAVAPGIFPASVPGLGSSGHGRCGPRHPGMPAALRRGAGPRRRRIG